MKVIVTGGAGFIGSAVCRWLIRETACHVVNVDKLTYAANLASLADIARSRRYCFERADVADRAAMERIFRDGQPDAVLHLAAESHVDRSIDDAAAFVRTNLVGTYVLLDVARRYWMELEGARRAAFRFLHVSTDEVYGSLGPSGRFVETTPYAPNSPYAASKAGSDHLVRAWHHTFGLPALISNCSNNYGPYQFPEKLIPLTILNAAEGKPLPVYGSGSNVRDWLHVEDHARALWMILRAGRPGESYNVGGGNERTNLEVVQRICAILDVLRPLPEGRPHAGLITFVPDRPGHDLRYAIDASKLCRELGWAPRESFETGLHKTVAWYLDRPDWWRPLREGVYAGQRLGLDRAAAPAAALAG